MVNILYLHTHDSGRFIQPYGYAIPTPTLMELAREGVLFRNCYCAAPSCSASRSAMLTGMNPHTNGMIGLAHRGFSIRNPQQHLANYLASCGFETVLCGVQHEISSGKEKELGYGILLHGEVPPKDIIQAYPIQDREPRVVRDFATAQAAADYLRQPKTRPFFLSVGLQSTHFDIPEPAPDIDPSFVQPPPSLPDNPTTRRDMAGYMTMARQADQCFGLVLEALQQNGHADDTLVLFTTDHGIAFPWMKCTLFDTGIGVALIMRFPNGSYQGKVVDALVSHLDIFPTLCDIVGIPQPNWLEGKSILSLVEGGVESIRQEVYAEVTYHAAYEPMRCIRTQRYKYIRYFDIFPKTVMPNIDWCSSKDFLLENGLSDQSHKPSEMFFDLYYDPSERNNLAENGTYTQVKVDLANRLKTWMEKTKDPLCLGPVPKPKGAIANRKDGIHPLETNWEA